MWATASGNGPKRRGSKPKKEYGSFPLCPSFLSFLVLSLVSTLCKDLLVKASLSNIGHFQIQHG
jgi:hypothetical protein